MQELNGSCTQDGHWWGTGNGDDHPDNVVGYCRICSAKKSDVEALCAIGLHGFPEPNDNPNFPEWNGRENRCSHCGKPKT